MPTANDQQPTSPALDALAAVVASRPGAEQRVGQQQMTAAVEQALASDTTCLVEAGTGTGKSFAYLVPAVLHATGKAERPDECRTCGAGEGAEKDCDDECEGMRVRPRSVVIATATKALQEQLFDKDLPFLSTALRKEGVRFSYAMLKGRSNYLCRARWEDRLGEVAVGADVLSDESGQVLMDAKAVGALRDWVEDTVTGDRAEVDVPDRAWRELSVSSEECPGKKACPFSEDCFVYVAREKAAEADIVVANTALYGAHLASGGRALPEHGALIVDEAHTLENVLAEALSVAVGPQRVRNLAYKLRRTVVDSDAFGELIKTSDHYAYLITQDIGNRVDPTSGDLADALREMNEAIGIALDEVDDSVDAVAALAATGGAAAKKTIAARAQVASIAHGLRDDIDGLLQSTDGSVSWVEDAAGGPRLRRAPVDIGPRLARDLFPNTTVVATSATLQVAKSFEPVKRRWGLLLQRPGGGVPDVSTAVADSPFSYGSQGFLYVAGHLPDPRGEQWAPRMHAELARLATAAGGRTLALFTSKTGMTAAVEYLRANTTLNVLAQGEAGRAQLLEEFTSGPGNVLCALASFWTGVDIPGPALSLVTIDKIPFPRRGEPLMDARRQAASRAGGNGFNDVDIPLAATDLAQGVGRLIRSTADRGAVALFDSRLLRKSYGRTLLASLPPLYPTTDPDQVEAALKRLVADLD